MSNQSVPTPSVAEPPSLNENIPSSVDSNNSSANSTDSEDQKLRSPRPKLGSRKPSGSIIIPRDSPQVELRDEVFDEDDARAMSPRRNSEDIEKMGRDARRLLEEEARSLQAKLLTLVDRVESVKSEHDKLEGENRFLQSYIGELMSTSKITSTGAAKSRSGRSK
ncbi:MAG: hypothetical protein M1817_000238 [Caeruleum heppii]|nr:MAG: hypothetical protein M1817_000238 [Caeruleum heppii]